MAALLAVRHEMRRKANEKREELNVRFGVDKEEAKDADSGGCRCDRTVITFEWLNLPRCKSHVRADQCQVDFRPRQLALAFKSNAKMQVCIHVLFARQPHVFLFGREKRRRKCKLSEYLKVTKDTSKRRQSATVRV